VDLVVTDPPFFDNVYYSELADFFYAWQVLHPRGFITRGHTTRRDREVQHADVYQFAEKLRAVLAECDRLLKEDGLLVFSYHHSKPNGWEALANSIWSSGFYVIRTHPVYAELAGATPKSQTKEPILFDAILVCRKQAVGQGIKTPIDRALSISVEAATVQLRRLAAIGLVPSQGDKFVIGVAQLLAALGAGYTGEEVGEIVKTHQMTLRDRLQRLEVSPLSVREERSQEPNYHQLNLF
jgi:putative DNA methylase